MNCVHECSHVMTRNIIKLLFISLVAGVCLMSCSKSDGVNLPSNFKSLSTEDKMEYLMAEMPADSVARFICNSAMGKIYNSRIELQPAMSYAYEHYSEEDQVKFEMEMANYESELPLHEKVKFSKLAALEDPDMYSYELGLQYVSSIREENKTIEQVSDELAKLRKECQSDPDFYKRFMKGFKTALTYDRHHDLDDKIYRKFITYPDNIK